MAKTASQIRLDDDLFEKIKIIAEKEYRTMNAQMEFFLQKDVEQYEKEHGVIRSYEQ